MVVLTVPKVILMAWIPFKRRLFFAVIAFAEEEGYWWCGVITSFIYKLSSSALNSHPRLG